MVRERCKVSGIVLLLAFPAWAFAGAQSSASNPLRLSLNHVTVSVAHLEEEAAWYERVLGFRRSALLGGRKDFGLYQMMMPGVRIDLVWETGSVNHRKVAGRMEQGWLHVVFDTPDLKSAYQYLVAKGTDVQVEKDDQQKIVHLTLHDPEGNEIGLIP
jgi:catechol 2,3-dioxygenase-like lactoylglutathione lyase family enzyme